MHWCNLNLAQRKRLQFFHTRSNGIALFNTLLGFREPYSRRICIMDVRIFLVLEREHPPTIKETSRAKNEETRSGKIDYKIQGPPHSAVQKEDSNRKEIVKTTDSTVRDAPEPWLVNRRFEQDWRIQSVQRKVEGVDRQHGYQAVLRAARDLF